ncbi:carbohydrate kinase family protein [Candidatus Wolfebacteria bacterium]|nr:carbohydrate kinase family protein [Candidatus Wolfebacteria bacterium]
MYDIITIGTATRDIFLTSPLFKVMKDKAHFREAGFPTGEAQCFALGGKIEISKPIFATGGGATNAAVTFSRQGFKTAAMIKIGKDQAGKDILEELKKEKINILKLQTNADTDYSTILLSPSGERTILVYRGASKSLSLDEIPFNKLKSKWVYIAPGKISFSVMEKIFDFFHKNGVLIAFNPSKRFIEKGLKQMSKLLNKSKVVFLNREEAAYLTKIDYNREKEIFKVLDKEILGIVAMTDGENGVTVSDGRRIYKAKVFKEKKMVDRTGAGDAFGSGFVAGLLEKREKCEKNLCNSDNIEYAIRLGSANATSVVEYVGAKIGILRKEDFKKNKRWNRLIIKRTTANY